ncbi:MAG TPA: 3-oxoacyl-ACP reductase family protein [Ramlibacter sp.]|nr:3-oxoacyl-ACP reductase family protein [Ramlibacter sp.]
MRLRDKVAIVTGSASGLGKAIALRLASEGATIVVADINPAAIDAAVSEIAATGVPAAGFTVDASNRAQVHAFMDKVAAKFGRIDILVNNAGITRYRPFATAADEDWDAVLNLDLKGVFYCAQAAAPHMRKQRYGKIVNIASSLGTGTTPHHTAGSPGGSSAYASAKAGVIQLTKTLARELGPDQINVNCIAPGFFLTPLTGATRSPEEVKDHIEVRTRSAVLNRPGKLEELASVVLFLASDESSFVAGQTICVDGGRTDRM